MAGRVERLRRVLEAGNGEDDLHLTEEGDRIPCIKRSHVGEILEGDTVSGGQVATEVNVVDVELETNDGRHGNTAMLELSMPEEFHGLLATHGPQTQRIEHLLTSLHTDALHGRQRHADAAAGDAAHRRDCGRESRNLDREAQHSPRVKYATRI